MEINMTNHTTLDYMELFSKAQVWAWTICVLGSLGNLFTLATGVHQLYLTKRRGKRRCRASPAIRMEADTLLLLHLSLCDLLYCSINLPIIAINYHLALLGASNDPSERFCTVTVVFRYINAITEWMTLGLLAVERCLDMGRVRTSRIFTPPKTCVLLASCWGIALFLQLLPFLVCEGNYCVFDTTTFKCDITGRWGKFIFYTMETALPCFLMLAGAARIIYQLCSNKRRLIATNMPRQIIERRSRSTRRSTALLLLLLTLFLICVIPNAVYNTISIVDQRFEESHVPLGLLTFMLYWVQYGVNFILYAAGNRNFRQAYVQFLKAVGRALYRCCRPRTSCCHGTLPAHTHDASAREEPITFISIPVVQVEDTSQEAPTKAVVWEDAWNTSSVQLMPCVTMGSLRPSRSSSSSSSSSSFSLFPSSLSSSSLLISYRTISLTSSASWDSSSTLLTCIPE